VLNNARIHIAGHSSFEKYTLDTHDHAPIDPVWKMYGHALEFRGPTNTLLEWDAHIPSFSEVHREALKANRFIRNATMNATDTEIRHDAVAV
jgi:uncharacterized protein (UPF0276 family)